MTTIPELLARLADTVPDRPAPLGELLDDGPVAVRHRRRAVVGGSMLAVLVVIGAGSVLHETVGDGRGQLLAPVSEPAPEPPPGTRYVGLGRVVVAVPTDWTIQDTACGPSDTPSIGFEGMPVHGCVIDVGPTASVPMPVPAPVHALFIGSTPVLPESALACSFDACSDIVTLDHASFYVTVTGDPRARQIVGAIIGSVRLLPDGFVTVPYPAFPRDLAMEQVVTVTRQLGRLGLGTEIAHTRSGLAGSVLEVDPEPGAVVPVGTDIALSVAGPTERGTVVGRVNEAAGGRPIEGAQVNLRTGGLAYYATTDDDGRFTRAVPPGSYRIEAYPPPGDPAHRGYRCEGGFDVAADQTADATVICRRPGSGAVTPGQQPTTPHD